MVYQLTTQLGEGTLTLETGKMARQADGAIWASWKDTTVLATVVAARTAKTGIDFLPLTVDYQEKFYAAGRIPGGFFKREGRLSERETLTSRLIDRPIRPLMPEGWFYETQVLVSVVSSDQSGVEDVLSVIAASAALTLSEIPFAGPVGAVRIGRVNNVFVVNPTLEQLASSDMNIVIAGDASAVTMVESESREVSEEEIQEAIMWGHKALQPVIVLQNALSVQAGRRPKRVVPQIPSDETLVNTLTQEFAQAIREAFGVPGKAERQTRLDTLFAEAILSMPNGADRTSEIQGVFEQLQYQAMRQLILQKGIRADGRPISEIRPITSEVGLLPRAHGSSLFTRGETQSLAAVTLGTADDAQRIDSINGESKKTFILHYNFPPFSVGEVKPMRGPGRREVGHGALAERALKQVMPSQEAFPYTVRVVSEILESNGSSSMATVCAGTLALMNAGVPIVRPVAGIAMGLVREGEQFQILTDILGVEDHLGDMDFKVAGTVQGITALQMDLKIGGLPFPMMKVALEAAKTARLHILECMKQTLEKPLAELSVYAPRITTLQVKKDKVREVIGPGGKVIRGIIETTGVKIDIEDSGIIKISSSDLSSIQKAIVMIKDIVEDVTVGQVYVGRITRITDFGAFVEIKRGVEGLVHISQLANKRVQKVTDEVSEGEEISVKVIEVDRQGKIRLSRKEALAP